MRTITFCEHDFATAQQMHAFLQRKLGFPEYYGGNLSALSDCLEDISQPTRIVVDRDNSVDEPWFDKACDIMARASLENENLQIVLK